MSNTMSSGTITMKMRKDVCLLIIVVKKEILITLFHKLTVSKFVPKVYFFTWH